MTLLRQSFFSKKKETHLKYVLQCSAMGEASAHVTSHLT